MSELVPGSRRYPQHKNRHISADECGYIKAVAIGLNLISGELKLKVTL